MGNKETLSVICFVPKWNAIPKILNYSRQWALEISFVESRRENFINMLEIIFGFSFSGFLVVISKNLRKLFNVWCADRDGIHYFKWNDLFKESSTKSLISVWVRFNQVGLFARKLPLYFQFKLNFPQVADIKTSFIHNVVFIWNCQSKKDTSLSLEQPMRSANSQ